MSSVAHKSVPNLERAKQVGELEMKKRGKKKEMKEERDLILSPSKDTSQEFVNVSGRPLIVLVIAFICGQGGEGG